MNNIANKICAGIVLYNPSPLKIKSNIESIYNDVEEIILVDNGSCNRKEIVEVVSKMHNIYLISNDDNLGIAKALNQMCLYAYERGYEWILTLDHDTNCSEGFLAGLVKYRNLDNIGIICPAVNYLGTNKKLISDNEIDEVNACMTSGSLTNLLAWKNVGGFNEDYFIDFVDNDFCMKLRINNYRIIRANDSLMNHELGELALVRLLGLFPRRVLRHGPLRLYYMTRNNLYFISTYKNQLNVPKEILKFFYVIGKELIFSDKKKESLKYVKRGYTDARNGKKGKY